MNEGNLYKIRAIDFFKLNTFFGFGWALWAASFGIGLVNQWYMNNVIPSYLVHSHSSSVIHFYENVQHYSGIALIVSALLLGAGFFVNLKRIFGKAFRERKGALESEQQCLEVYQQGKLANELMFTKESEKETNS